MSLILLTLSMACLPNSKDFVASEMFVRINERDVTLVIHTKASTPITICSMNLRVLGIFLLLILLENCDNMEIDEVEEVELADDMLPNSESTSDIFSKFYWLNGFPIEVLSCGLIDGSFI